MNEKKNIHETNCNLQSRLNLIEEKGEVPDSVKKDIFNFIEDLGLGKVNLGKRVSRKKTSKEKSNDSWRIGLSEKDLNPLMV